MRFRIRAQRPSRWRLAAAVLTASVLFAATAGATLTGSTFEGDDGNIVQGSGIDWAGDPPNFHYGCDIPDPCSGSSDKALDNSFGGGAKEDDVNPPIETGSIPTSKSDLTRFYEAHETLAVSGSDHVFLYLGWERANTSGTVNYDFEFNQSKTLAGNGVTPIRTTGDMLITYDFAGGSNTVTLGLRRWLASGAWGPSTPLTGFAKGGVNQSSFTDSILSPPAANTVTRQATEFGEAEIDLTRAGVFQTGSCLSFGKAYVKTRSSTSFTAQMKDFIAPIDVDINNCGGLSVSKYIDVNADGDDDGIGDPASAGWAFTVKGPSPATTTVCSGETNASGALVCSTGSLANLQPGDYVVTETQETGFVNTDPGPLPGSTGATVSRTVTVPAQNTVSTSFGNTCYVAKTFKVTGVPATTTQGVFIKYTITSGLNASATPVKVNLVKAAQANTDGTFDWSAVVSDKFIYSTTFDWEYGVTVGGIDQTKEAFSDEFLGDITVNCAATNEIAFAGTEVTAFKFKDADADGVYDTDEVGMEGWTFQLRTNASPGTLIATTTSDADGNVSFENIGPGTYRVVEVGQTGWKQTVPTTNGLPTGTPTYRLVTVALDDTTKDAGVFGNSPYSRINVAFTALATLSDGITPATTSTINCSPDNVAQSTTGAYAATNLLPGTYSCTVVIVDP